MAYLFVLAVLPWIIVPYKWLRARPIWGVAIALIPSVFVTEDLHENFFVASTDQIPTFHSIKIAGVFRLTELILFFLTLVFLSRISSWRTSLKTPIDFPVTFLLVALPLTGLISILRGADPVYALAYNMWRTFWWSLVFFYFCVSAIDEDLVGKAFKTFYVALILRMAYGTVKFTLGYGETHALYRDTSIVFWDGLDMHLASGLLVMSALLLVNKSELIPKWGASLGLFLSTFAILFSLRRSPIANVGIAFLLLFVLFPVRNKFKLVFAGIIVLFIGAAVISLASAEGEEVIRDRVAELFTTDLETLDAFHLFDPLDHLVAIMEKPIAGLGFGIPFKRTFLIREQETTFSHNAYLFVWGGMGVLGLFVYLWLYLRVIFLTRKKFESLSDSGVLLGSIGMIFTALAQGIYSTVSFTSSRTPFVLAFMMALIVKYRQSEYQLLQRRSLVSKEIH